MDQKALDRADICAHALHGELRALLVFTVYEMFCDEVIANVGNTAFQKRKLLRVH